MTQVSSEQNADLYYASSAQGWQCEQWQSEQQDASNQPHFGELQQVDQLQSTTGMYSVADAKMYDASDPNVPYMLLFYPLQQDAASCSQGEAPGVWSSPEQFATISTVSTADALPQLFYPMQQDCTWYATSTADALPKQARTKRTDSWADSSPDDEKAGVSPSDDVEHLSSSQATAMAAWLTKGSAVDRKFALQQISSLARRLEHSQLGSRVIQQAMETATGTELTSLMESFRGRILEMCKGLHSNFVVQKAIEVLPPEEGRFIIRELKGRAVVTARHRFGCRIMQRLLERFPAADAEELAVEILSDGVRLVRHPYGNFVMQHLIIYGGAAHRAQAMKILNENCHEFAKHKIGRYVLQNALKSATFKEREQFPLVVLREFGDARHHHGNRARYG